MVGLLKDVLLKIACVIFSTSGEELAKRLKRTLEHQPFSWLTRPLSLFQSYQFPRSTVDIFTKDKHTGQFADIFQNYDGIIFFCATGPGGELFVEKTVFDGVMVAVAKLSS